MTMKTKSLMMAALTVMCAMTFMVLTSCTSDNHDNPVPTPSEVDQRKGL